MMLPMLAPPVPPEGPLAQFTGRSTPPPIGATGEQQTATIATIKRQMGNNVAVNFTHRNVAIPSPMKRQIFAAFLHPCLHGGGEVDAAFAAEGAIDVFESLDQVAHLGTCGRTASGFAKMRATSERSGVVDLAAMVFQKRAGTVGITGRQAFPTRGAPCTCCEQSFAASEVRGFSGEGKVTTGRATDAGPFERSLREFGIHGLYLVEQSAVL